MFFTRKYVEPKRIEPSSGPDRPVDWPSGIAVRAGDTIWYIKGNQCFEISSDRILESWGFYVADGTVASLENFSRAGTLGFRDGTLIRDFSDGKIYLISGSRRRHITSPDVLRLLDWNILDVSKDEVMMHQEGEPLNAI